MRHADIFSALLAVLLYQAGQDPARKPIVGTVSSFRANTAELQVAPERGEAVWVKLSAATDIRKVAPGEKDLMNAAAIQATEISAGDRVLVSFIAGDDAARRIVVMSASDITRRNEAGRQDWLKRGKTGIIVAVRDNTITLRQRSFQGEAQTTIQVDAKTVIRRYAPDSVRFADARPSSLAEIHPGDQLRARGHEPAEEIVFGTFRTSAGPIKSVNAAANEFLITDLATNKPLVVKLAAESQLKQMPGFPSLGPGAGPGPGPGMMPGPPPDLSQMFERMPACRMEDLKPGQYVAVSSTKGATSGQVTAIMVLANAEMLLRMAGMQNGGRQRPDAAPNMGSMVGLNGTGISGLELPGLIP